MDWRLEAVPRSSESTFQKVRIGRQSRVEAMELADSFGQQTIAFSRIERNRS
jgi:hypothetical protein